LQSAKWIARESTTCNAYTAADGGPFVGSIDMTTGVLTPIVLVWEIPLG
jgi:hypothetical protein